MSNLIKSNFVAFSRDDKIVLDTNKYKVIREMIPTNIIQNSDENIDDLEVEDILNEDFEAGIDKFFVDKEVDSEENIETARQSAQQILDEAMDEATRILAEARENASLISEEAKKNGYSEGYNDGIAKAENEILAKQNEFNEFVEDSRMQLEKEADNMATMVETAVVDIACDLIEKLTGIVVNDYKGVMLYIVNSAIKDVDNSKKFIIKISDDDYDEIETNKNEIYGALNPSIEMEVFADSKLSKGQCVIETDGGLVDCSVDVQLENMINALKLISIS